jgi:hypothetical protein
MSNVVPFPPKDSVLTTVAAFEFEPEDSIDSRLPFSFDIIQHEAKGMVFLEACVPAAMAVTFLQMLTAAAQGAAAPLAT